MLMRLFPSYSAWLTGEPACGERNMPAGSDGEQRNGAEGWKGEKKQEGRNEIEGGSGEGIVGWGRGDGKGREEGGGGERGRFDPACAPGQEAVINTTESARCARLTPYPSSYRYLNNSQCTGSLTSIPLSLQIPFPPLFKRQMPPT